MNPEVNIARKWYRWSWISPLLTIPSVVLLVLIDPGFKLICGGIWRNCALGLRFVVTGLIAILGSALWHLVLLNPALNKQREFGRWHGLQTLLMAGIRTVIPVAFLIFGCALGEGSYYIFGSTVGEDIYYYFFLFSIPVLVVVWLLGTLWGQGQAARGDCALMRWTGHGAGLPLPIGTEQSVSVSDLEPLIHEESIHRTAYNQGLSFREQGKLDEAVIVFHGLLDSSATTELKSMVAKELEGITGTNVSQEAELLVGIIRFSRNTEQRRMALARLENLGLVESL